MNFRYLCFLSACLLQFTVGQAARAETRIENTCLGNSIVTCFILVEGQIEAGLTDRFQERMEAGAFDGYTVYLNSPGGNLGEAIRFGRFLRASGFSTAVGGSQGIPKHANGDPNFRDTSGPTNGSCESACAYVFMGGLRRRLRENDRLGLHQFFAPDLNIGAEVAQKFSGQLVSYMIEMEVDARIFSLASRASSKDMYFVSLAEAEQYDLVTRRGFDDVFLEPYKTGLIAASKRIDAVSAYDWIDQISFFCRGGTPYALLHAPHHGLSEGISMDASIMTANAMRQDLERDVKATYRISGKSAYITLSLSTAVVNQVLTADRIMLGASVMRAAGGLYGASIEPSGMDRKMIEAAFKYCID